jgi:hypothetical protein
MTASRWVISPDKTAEKYGFTREQMDAYAKTSTERAVGASKSGAFNDEIASVTVKGRKGDEVVKDDETPFSVNVEKIPTLRPAFNKDGTVTAATSSSISDGAAALVLMTESEAKKRGAKPLARIVAYASNAHEPEWFTTAPVGAIEKVLEEGGLEGLGRRPLRGERGVRGRDHGGNEGRGHPAREGERERRRGGARTSDRRDRRPHHHHAHLRAQEAQP